MGGRGSQLARARSRGSAGKQAAVRRSPVRQARRQRHESDHAPRPGNGCPRAVAACAARARRWPRVASRERRAVQRLPPTRGPPTDGRWAACQWSLGALWGRGRTAGRRWGARHPGRRRPWLPASVARPAALPPALAPHSPWHHDSGDDRREWRAPEPPHPPCGCWRQCRSATRRPPCGRSASCVGARRTGCLSPQSTHRSRARLTRTWLTKVPLTEFRSRSTHWPSGSASKTACVRESSGMLVLSRIAKSHFFELRPTTTWGVGGEVAGPAATAGVGAHPALVGLELGRNGALGDGATVRDEGEAKHQSAGE